MSVSINFTQLNKAPYRIKRLGLGIDLFSLWPFPPDGSTNAPTTNYLIHSTFVQRPQKTYKQTRSIDKDAKEIFMRWRKKETLRAKKASFCWHKQHLAAFPEANLSFCLYVLSQRKKKYDKKIL